MKQARRLFLNVLFMTGVSLLMRGVGVAFQILLSNRVGAEAMGLFSLLSGVYGFALTLATSGIHLGVTRAVVDAIGDEEPHRVRPALLRAVLYALFFGLLSSALLFSLAEPIGRVWLKDLRTVRPLRLLALTLPLLALSSVFAGYFAAVRRVWKSGTAQILEQGIKMAATVALLTPFLPRGIEGACTALVLGGLCAEVCSFLFQALLFLLDRRRSFPRGKSERVRGEGRKLLGITLPVALTTYLRSGLLTLEHILIPEGLRRGGVSHGAALAAYGCIQSMALPVVLFPAALIGAFAGQLVPEFAERRARKEEKRINYMVGRTLWLSAVFSIGVAGLLLAFSDELGTRLYPNTDAAVYIRYLAPLIPIMYVDTATDAMLKGMGQQVFSMIINVADAATSVLLVLLLIPRFGIMGYVMTIYISELFNTSASIARLFSITTAKARLGKWVLLPLLSIVGATALTRLCLHLTRGTGELPLLLFALPVLLLYLALLYLTGCIDREDRQWARALLLPDRSRAVPTVSQRNSRRYCRPANAALSVSESREKSATSECGLASGSSCSMGTK